MIPVPLGIGSYKRGSAYQPEVVLRNMLLEEDKSSAAPSKFMQIDRAGLTPFVVLGATIRGLHRQDGLFGGLTYAAAGTSLYAITTGVSSNLGSIGSGERVIFSANYEFVFPLSGFTQYIYDGVTVDPVAMPDGRDVQDSDVLNNYLVLGCPDGRFYWLVPGSATVDGLDFATAESSPDGLKAVKRLGDEILFFGETGGEVWQSTGDADAPFVRAGGRNFDRGCMARDAVLRFDNSILWVGNDGVVYRYGNVPQRISDHGIEQRLRERTDLPSACLVEQDGHKLYVLKIPGQGDFAFDAASGEWSEFATGEGPWDPHVSCPLDDGWLVGSSTTGKVWNYEPDAASDDGVDIVRVVTGNVTLPGLPDRHDSFNMMVGGSDDFTVSIRWKDGQDDWPLYAEVLDVRAPGDTVNLWRLGQPDQPYRSFEVTIREQVKARISAAWLGDGWQ